MVVKNDPASVLTPTTTLDVTDSLNDKTDSEDYQDPTFINEFTPDYIPLNQQEDDEYVTKLFVREKCYQFGSPQGLSESQKIRIQKARLESIEWVMQRRVRLKLQYQTAYLSIMYFDRFLSLQWHNLHGKDWRMRLLMLTCLLLAAKMEEVRVMKLTDFIGGDRKFNFGEKRIKTLENRVLKALHWEMWFISPFCFVRFFVRHLFQPLLPSREAVSRAALIIFQAATGSSTMEFKPSIMAMAATLLVMDGSLTKAEVAAKIRKSAVTDYGFAATAEEVHSCYEMIKQVVVDDKTLLLVIKSPSCSVPELKETGGSLQITILDSQVTEKTATL